MNAERRFIDTARKSRGTKDDQPRRDRVQIALRPTSALFNSVMAYANARRLSWNEAALRLLEAGLKRQ